MPLIVLEGPEGAGKTTQLARLAERLTAEGKKVVSLREPGGTLLGDSIRAVLLDPAQHIDAAAEALLFMASRAQLVEWEIKPALASGAVVLLDRFFLSTYAYQVRGRGLDEKGVIAANKLATAGVKPDLTILLSLPVEEGLARAQKRGAKDRIEQAESAFHQRVGGAFKEFAGAAWQKKHPEAGPIATVDATGSVDDVHARVIAAVKTALSIRA